MLKNKRFWILLLLILAGMVVFTGLAKTQRAMAQAPAPTQNPGRVVTDNDVNRVAKKLYCPVCPNTPLDVCETKACQDWRAQIRDQLKAGWTDQQVMDSFVRSYGERVLAEPERGGFTSLVWMLPVLAFVIGIILVGLILKSWRSSQRARPVIAQQAPPVAPAVSREVLARIEAEIRQMD